jgi:four helix bundle protein
VGSGQWAVGSRQWAVGSGQWAVGSGQWAVGSSCPLPAKKRLKDILMSAKNYRDLIVWQKSMALVVAVYEITKRFPKEETYGLTSQIRRAAVSIPSNIAEGEGRESKKEFSHFLLIAYGSLREVETQVFISEKLKYIDESACNTIIEQCNEIGKLINGLKRSLR